MHRNDKSCRPLAVHRQTRDSSKPEILRLVKELHHELSSDASQLIGDQRWPGFNLYITHELWLVYKRSEVQPPAGDITDCQWLEGVEVM